MKIIQNQLFKAEFVNEYDITPTAFSVEACRSGECSYVHIFDALRLGDGEGGERQGVARNGIRRGF